MAKYTGGQGILESAALMSKNMYYNTCCKLLVRVWGGGNMDKNYGCKLEHILREIFFLNVKCVFFKCVISGEKRNHSKVTDLKSSNNYWLNHISVKTCSKHLTSCI